ncbi:esterase, partial [Streptomyces sp. 12297]
MGLTSGALLACALLCTALVFTVTVWLWPRLARRGCRPVLGRIGLLAVVQVLVLASVGLTANRS